MICISINTSAGSGKPPNCSSENEQALFLLCGAYDFLLSENIFTYRRPDKMNHNQLFVSMRNVTALSTASQKTY